MDKCLQGDMNRNERDGGRGGGQGGALWGDHEDRAPHSSTCSSFSDSKGTAASASSGRPMAAATSATAAVVSTLEVCTLKGHEASSISATSSGSPWPEDNAVLLEN